MFDAEFGLPVPVPVPAASGLSTVAFPSGRTQAAFGAALRREVHGPWSVVTSVARRLREGSPADGPVAERTAGTALAVGVVHRLR